MGRFALGLLLIGVSGGGMSQPVARPAAVSVAKPPSSLISALRVADFAEIYVISPSISFPVAPRPETVRMVGCKYGVGRRAVAGDTEWWRDLEQSLRKSDLRFLPARQQPELRIGLVLSDRLGTLWEIYSEDLPDVDGKIGGIDQRRQVKMSGSFATVLKNFAARHPELLLSDPGGHTPYCAQRRPILPGEPPTEGA